MLQNYQEELIQRKRNSTVWRSAVYWTLAYHALQGTRASWARASWH